MRLARLLVLLASAGCTTEEPPSGAGPVALDDYCEVTVGATCRWQLACGCDPSTPLCGESMTGCISLVEGMRRSIAAGTTAYDGMAARRQADRIAAASCEQKVFEAWGFHAGELLDLGGAFRGRLPPGSACSIGNLTPGDDTGDHLGSSVECADGLCIDNRCVELRGVGEPCDATVRCFDYSIEPWDWDYEQRPACSGTCQPLGAVGHACADNAECATYRCDAGVCVDAFGCAPGTTCGPTDLPLGTACSGNRECTSRACEGTCVTPACSRHPL